MALNVINGLHQSSLSLLIVDAYYKAKDFNHHIEGVLFTKITLEPNGQNVVLFYRNSRHSNAVIEFAMERASGLYDITESFVVDIDALIQLNT